MNQMLPSNHGDNSLTVLSVYQDIDGLWRFRREGDLANCAYALRRDAVTAARVCGELAGSYRLHLQLPDGRFMLELLNVHAAPTTLARPANME